MKANRIIAILLAFVMIFSLTACSEEELLDDYRDENGELPDVSYEEFPDTSESDNVDSSTDDTVAEDGNAESDDSENSSSVPNGSEIGPWIEIN